MPVSMTRASIIPNRHSSSLYTPQVQASIGGWSIATRNSTTIDVLKSNNTSFNSIAMCSLCNYTFLFSQSACHLKQWMGIILYQKGNPRRPNLYQRLLWAGLLPWLIIIITDLNNLLVLIK